MLMPPHFVYGLFNVFRPDIGCIASDFLICCPLAELHYRLLVKMGEVLSAQGKEMGEIKSNLAALSARPDIGCIASDFLICCPLAELHYRLLVHVFLW
jgi:hypothetical protein